MTRFPDESALREFLEKERRSTVISESLIAVFLCVVGIVCVLATYGLVVAISWLAFLRESNVPHWIAMGYLAAIFLSYPRHDSERLTQLEVDTTDGRAPWSIDFPGGIHASNLNIISTKTVGSMAKVITQVLFVAPRSFAALWRAVAKARALAKADARACAPAFSLLLRKGRRVPYSELAREAGSDPSSVLSLLLVLNLAQHLPTEPVGMVVLSSVREKLCGTAPD